MRNLKDVIAIDFSPSFEISNQPFKLYTQQAIHNSLVLLNMKHFFVFNGWSSQVGRMMFRKKSVVLYNIDMEKHIIIGNGNSMKSVLKRNFTQNDMEHNT